MYRSRIEASETTSHVGGGIVDKCVCVSSSKDGRTGRQTAKQTVRRSVHYERNKAEKEKEKEK